MKNTNSNARPIQIPIVGYGETTKVAQRLGVTKQVASYNLKRGKMEYVKVLFEIRDEEAAEWALMQARFQPSNL